MMIIVLILVIAFMYYSTGSKIPQYFSDNKKSPEALLKERFVTGEIDETTYLNMKQIIGK